MERTDQITTSASGTAPAGAPERAAVTSAADARAYAESAVRERWDGTDRGVRDEDVVDLLLVVSELVTNAIRHGGGLAGFDVRTTDDGVWIAVHDNSPVIPRAVCAFPTRHHGSGYGWPLVARLTRDVVVERNPEGGKTISALVRMRPAGT
ncbi:ATP-binding protein [Streptomyces sp. SID5910]|uniref:ATP-binding protein n=1 Tax=Streptomyces sp. SID5910 TaxID=2690312 RepID=UPI0013685B0A|nr:ATP-binding protein [Streptomyces sp. SID5910]MYR46424.1 ATP-binding protein [Streptomyces sp. SID5910]